MRSLTSTHTSASSCIPTQPTTDQTRPYQDGMYGREALLAMLGMALVVILSALDQTVVSTALPRMIADLNGFALYPWVATSYLLTSTIMVPIMGKLGDMYGRKNFLLVSIIIFVVSSVVAGAATSMLMLIIARGVQGIGAGMFISTAFASVGEMFPQPERRARWQGIMSGSFGIASAVGPALGGVLTEAFGWRSVFYINLPTGMLALLVIWFNLPYNLTPRVQHKHIDWQGALTITLGVSTLLLAVEMGGELAWLSPMRLALLASSIVFLILFVVIQHRSPEPLLPPDIFKSRTVVLCTLLSLSAGFALFGLIFYTPLLTQGSMGLSPSVAGALQTPLIVCMAGGSLLSGQLFALTQRARPLMITGAIALIIGASLLSQVSLTTNQLVLSAELALCGLGIGMILPMLIVLVQANVPRNRLGVGTSTVQFLRLMGSTVGTAIIGALVSGMFAANVLRALPSTTNPSLVQALLDPQSLIHPAGQAHLATLVQQSAMGMPLEQVLAVSREALAVGVKTGYLVAVATAVVILVLVLSLRNVLPVPGPIKE